MMRLSALALGLLAGAACGGPPARLGPTLPPPSTPPPAATAPSVAAPAGPARAVTSDPDVPSGPAAARDAELAAKVAPIVDAAQTMAAELTPDGRRLVFVSTRDGLPQLYSAPAGDAAGAATRLVSSGERVDEGFFIGRDGKRVIYRSDKGADENWSIFSVGLDGKNATELTPGETLVRGTPIEPDGARGRIFYTARLRREGRSALHELRLTPGAKPRVVMTAQLPLALDDVSRDGTRLLVVEQRARTDQTLSIVETAGGTARKLYPTTGEARIDAARFSVDGLRVFVATDAGGEQAVLLALDAKTGKELARYTEPATGAMLGECVRAQRLDRLACDARIGERSELRILDGKTLKPTAAVKLPDGVGRPDAFSEDGARVVAIWSTPSSARDALAIDVKTGAVTPLRKEARPGLEGLPELEVSVTAVPAHDGLKLPVIVTLPAGDKGKKRPVIVDYHGGPAGVSGLGWKVSRRFYTALGYAYVEPNVRGSSGYGRAYEMADNGPRRVDSLKDIETTGRWVAAQPWADGGRLVIYGGSYGGYTVLIGLTRMQSLWRAGVDMFGVASMTTLLKITAGDIREVFKLEMGDPEKDQEFLESISPLRDADKIADPLFVYAGENDPRVPRSESDSIVRAVRARGLPVEYMVAPNEGHSISRRENQIAFLSRAARFLEDVLR